jgi:hypothetical protein
VSISILTFHRFGRDGLLRLRGRAKPAGALHDAVQQLRRAGDHFHATDRRVVLVLPDLQLFDREVAAQVHDHVHDLRQHHRVDDVARQN